MRRFTAVLATLLALITSLSAVPPAWATTWTVTPGGPTTGTSTGSPTITDTSTGTVITCASWSTTHTFASGTGLSGTGIASVTGLTAVNCTGPSSLALSLTATNLPWSVNAVSHNPGTGTSTLTLTGIKFHMSGILCSADIAGPTAATPGTVNATYTNSTGRMVLTGVSGNLHYWNVAGCLGLIRSGDPVSIAATIRLLNIQTVIGG